MNIRRSMLMLALLFSVAAVAGNFVPATLAHITAQSNTLVNTFDAPCLSPDEVQVQVTVHKTVHNVGTERISPNGFRFKLESNQSSIPFVMTVDASGYASVTLSFSEADLGKTYTYRLSEINDQRENVIYSKQVYTIRLTPEVNADNQIVVAATVDGVPVENIVAAFENIYSAGSNVPLTGDNAHPLMYALLMVLSGAGMIALKRKGRAA